MSNTEELRAVDENHLWYKGKQFISLGRFLEVKRENIKEIELLNDEVSNLKKENEAYECLLFKNKKGN